MNNLAALISGGSGSFLYEVNIIGFMVLHSFASSTVKS